MRGAEHATSIHTSGRSLPPRPPDLPAVPTDCLNARGRGGVRIGLGCEGGGGGKRGPCEGAYTTAGLVGPAGRDRGRGRCTVCLLVVASKAQGAQESASETVPGPRAACTPFLPTTFWKAVPLDATGNCKQ